MKRQGVRMARLLGLLSVVSAIAACTTSTAVPVTRPPEARGPAELWRIAQNENRPIRLAVADFSGQNADSLRAVIESEFTNALSGTGRPAFIVVEDFNQAALERRLGRSISNLRDPSTAVELGRLTNAETLIFADVEANTVSTKTIQESKEVCAARDGEGNCTQKRSQIVPCEERTAEVSFTGRMVSLRSGRILYSGNFSGDRKAKKCAASSDTGLGAIEGFMGALSGTQSNTDLLNSARAEAVDDFMKQVAPYSEDVRVVWRTKGENLSSDSRDRMRGAIKFADQGQVDEGCRRISELAQRERDYDLTYNVAVCQELQGNLEGALRIMERLQRAAIEPDPQVSKRILELQRQLADRPTG